MSATRTSARRPLSPGAVQLARAALAAVAALMITFSTDHSALVGLSVFSGFALVTALIHMLAAWQVAPAGWRWPFILLAAVSILTGMAGGVPAWRSTPLFFVVVIAWGALTGLIELIAGLRARRLARTGSGTAIPAVVADGARDGILVGSLGLALAAGLLCVPTTYALRYSIAEAGSFTLTGITLAVGIFGAYAAIVAVFLGIAGLSPRSRTRVDAGAETTAAATASAENEGSA